MSFSPSQAGRSAQGGLEYKWKVLISVIFGIFMIILDSTVINVALQTLRREYDATLTSTQWIISIYVLALGIMTPLSGFLADRFGIKRMYIGGLILFVIGSILCGVAPTLTLLIAARVVQGIGGGIAQPLGPPQLYRAFPPQEQGTALGYFGVALVLAPALGPILGGLLVDANLWRWIFFINVPIGITGVILASRWLKRDDTTRKPRLDPLGMLLAVTAFGALLYAATNAADLGWTSSTVLTWFIVGGVALMAFGVVELFVAKEPLLDLRLFQRKQFAVAALVGYVTVLALFGAEFLMPVYLQALRGRTAFQTGLLLLPLAISSGIVTPIAGRLYDKIGPRILVIIGFGLLIINTWQFSKIEALTPISTLMWLLALRGVSLGLIVQTTFTTALSAVPRNLLPRGSSLLNGTRFVVQSIGVAVLATILSSSVSQTTKDFQQRAQETVPAAGATAFGLCETPGVPAEQNIPTAAQQAPPAQQAQIKAAINQACHENLAGFENAYLFTFYFAIVALGIGAFLPGWPFKWSGRTAAPAEQPAASGAH